jgi:O-antigen biosynthesis protein WbqP
LGRRDRKDARSEADLTAKRIVDIAVAAVGIVLFAVPALVIAILIKLTSKGPVLYWSDRVGRYNRLFSMPKFRTMRVETPAVATHLLDRPDQHLTPIGALLRKTSLDELPQLWSILAGDMTVVGPRPALFNQDDLIQLRTAAGVHVLTPGLTGWAQVRGRDELTIPVKVELDRFYLEHHGLGFDAKIIGLTLVQVIRGDGIRH